MIELQYLIRVSSKSQVQLMNCFPSKDVVEVLIRNLSDEAIIEVETFIRKKHGEVISVKNSSGTLEGLFLKIYAANISNSKTDV